RLRRSFEKQKNFETKILVQYTNYERELDLWKDLKEKQMAAVETYCRTMKLGTALLRQRAASIGLLYGMRTYARGGSLGDALFGGWYASYLTRLKDMPKLTRFQSECLAKLNQDVKQAIEE